MIIRLQMTTLRDFITAREAEIKSQVKALRAELGDLKKAKSALDPSSGEIESGEQQSGSVTIKDMVRAILKSDSSGLTATDILTKIKENFARDLGRTSLSPQLSRMKEDGEVVVRENLWFLVFVNDSIANGAENIEEEFLSGSTSNWDTDWEDDSEVPF